MNIVKKYWRTDLLLRACASNQKQKAGQPTDSPAHRENSVRQEETINSTFFFLYYSFYFFLRNDIYCHTFFF